ncbi:MAG: saccharopine dehydrogenase NADP-binding domain-containing protein [Sphingomonadales bacterium]|nr:saccharopine dehydrogenase NADP-binding domain-containing protein [Sphingomonadales bacterium]
MTKADRPFDLVIYGATGFTGRLVAEYLASHYNGSGPRWAMAGRSADKLAEVRDLVGAPADTPLIVSDAADPASLAAMAGQTRVVLTTVGPYQLYGEPLVRACIAAGTDYADLCGEPLWMRRMIDGYGDAAAASGARICFSSGFDSIPFDLGVVMLQQACQERFGQYAPRVRGRVRGMKGTFSGGTAASFHETMAALGRDRSLIALLTDPFALVPGFAGPPQPRGDAVIYDDACGSWATPFVMASINTKNVHRTHALLGHPWGADFTYDEMVLTGPGDKGEALARAMAATPMIGGPNDPKPGEGPSQAERDSGYYDVLMLGELPDGRSLRYGIKGRYDPGYGSTSRMIAETGLALLSCTAPGGIGTPGALLGPALVERLREHAEIAFAVEA